jgi:hypothetical protein
MKKATTRRIIKRKRGTTQYFGPKEDQAIIDFQKSSEIKDRERLYNTLILPAFDKLVENLIFIHEFYRIHDSYETLKQDCIEFLYETIYKWDSTRGTKAFSYFNVVAKNWLIIQAKKRIKYLKRNVSLDDPRSMASHEIEAIQNFDVIPSPDSIRTREERMDAIFNCLYEIRGKLSNANELLCIEAVIVIFERMDDLDFFNKRAVFLYLREISGLTPKQLTAAVSSLKKNYRELRGKDGFDIF